MKRLLAVAACCIFLTPMVRGEDDVPLPNYFVAPITTQLQRDVVSSTADVYAGVNCNAVQAEADGSSFTLPDKEALLADLKQARHHGPHLRLDVWFHMPPTVESEQIERVSSHMTELAKAAGFEQVSTTEGMTSTDWSTKLSPARSAELPTVELPDVQETPFGDEMVRVYPVRTPLSRFVLGEVNCVVQVLDPIDSRAVETWPQLSVSIAQNVRALQLAAGGRLRFTLTTTAAGAKLAEDLFDSKPAPTLAADVPTVLRDLLEQEAAKYQPSPAMALVKELGFQSFTASLSSGGGAPDLLVGEAAPDFTLQRLGGGDIKLQQFIKGRPALITFWGLACGPCRVEAPHLSKLYQRYGQQGFEVIAVNAYDDSVEDVAQYVADEKLTYPIALQGGSVAKEQYKVGAHPTTFWIDSDGKVVDYDIGFTNAQRVERQIQKMLKATR